MGNALRAVKAQPDSGKVKAFARRIAQFTSRDDSRPAIAGVCRVAPGVWVATDGHRLAMIPAPLLADGTRWGDDCPCGAIFKPGDIATLADAGVPVARHVLRPDRSEPIPYGTGTRVIPAAMAWQLTAGGAAAWAIDANFPDYTRIIPRLADLPLMLAVDPAAIRATLDSANGDTWTTAERLRAGGKPGKLGATLKRNDGLIMRFSADGKMGCQVQVNVKTLDADGEAWGGVTAEPRDLGDLGDDKPAIALNPWFLLDVADTPYTLRYADGVGPCLALANGEAHVIMPMRL